jgi:dephospho-CoA kinase
MIIVGLTGSVASGKSTVAGWMREKGIAVHDADAAVHSLLAANGQAVAEIIARFGPDMAASDGGIDRKKLGGYVFANPAGRKTLESILHPLVRQHRDKFLQDQQRLGRQIVVLDVPLLYETGGDRLCDYVIVVFAGEDTIRQRALSRPGMTAEKLSGILATQMPASEKCQRADFVLDTELDPDITRQHLFSWLDQITDALDTSKR